MGSYIPSVADLNTTHPILAVVNVRVLLGGSGSMRNATTKQLGGFIEIFHWQNAANRERFPVQWMENLRFDKSSIGWFVGVFFSSRKSTVDYFLKSIEIFRSTQVRPLPRKLSIAKLLALSVWTHYRL